MALTAPLAGLHLPASTLGGQQQQPLQFYLQLPGTQSLQQHQQQQGSVMRLNLWDMISMASRVQQGQQCVVGWQGTQAAGRQG
jgi:hypothetical protein